MSLKILLFPTLIVLSVVLIIGYIKPDIEAILTKRDEEATKTEELRNVETVEGNIRSLSQGLNRKSDLETLVKRYFPESIDQERSLDVINFLAQQTGVAVTGVSMNENPVLQPEQPTPEVAPSADPFAATPEAGTAPIPAAPEPQRSYRAEIGVMGTYNNLRNFFDRLYHTDRMRVAAELTLQKPSDSERFRQEQEIIPADFLKGTIALDFAYAPAQSTGNALHQPLFQKNTLDLGVANRLVDFVNSPVGDLVPASPGRSNPFEAVP